MFKFYRPVGQVFFKTIEKMVRTLRNTHCDYTTEISNTYCWYWFDRGFIEIINADIFFCEPRLWGGKGKLHFNVGLFKMVVS